MSQNYSAKTSYSNLRSIPLCQTNDILDVDLSTIKLISIPHQGKTFDYLWKPSDEKRLFVLLCGDAKRERYPLPVFQRWSWAPQFPGACLYISDPTLRLADDLGLAWYSGSGEFDPLPVVADIVAKLAIRHSIPPSCIIPYGSSGGGFAALRLAAILPSARPVAVNPQTDVTKFKSKNVEKFLASCFPGFDRRSAVKRYPDRFSLFSMIDALSARSIFIAQNLEDQHHVKDHYEPFCAALEAAENYDPRRLVRIEFSDERGHAAAEPVDVFEKILAAVTA